MSLKNSEADSLFFENLISPKSSSITYFLFYLLSSLEVSNAYNPTREKLLSLLVKADSPLFLVLAEYFDKFILESLSSPKQGSSFPKSWLSILSAEQSVTKFCLK